MIKFERHPEIAMNKEEWRTGLFRVQYRRDYERLFRDVKAGVLTERDVLRTLLATDLWFMVRFGFGIEKANHPFVVQACKDVQRGPASGTLDIWAREHFKAIDVNEPVLTTEGWSSHGMLKPGDKVFHPGGMPVEVLARTEVFLDAPCKRVEFNDGYAVTVSANHLWERRIKVRSRIKNSEKRNISYRYDVVRARDLMPGDDVGTSRALFYPAKDLPIPPYTLGAWLGDGHSAGARLTCAYSDMAILDNIRAEGIAVKEQRTEKENCGLFSLGDGVRGKKGTGLTPALRALGIIKNKHIPTIYLESSIKQRWELLRGLMDTDGTIDERGTATFANKSGPLSKDVYELAACLGLRPRIRRHESIVNGVPYPFFQVSFQAYNDQCPFRLRRKASRCKNGKRMGTASRLVKNVSDVASIPVSCIQVNAEDGRYLVGRQLVPTHNSTIITMAETLQKRLRDPEGCSGIFAYVRPAAKAFLRSIKVLCETSDLLKYCFPDVLWEKPEVQAPKWSEDDGLVFKRKSSARKESTIEAWGLIEGMPTGRHFEDRVYDDIETDDIRESPDMLAKCFSKFEMSDNLGVAEGGTERVVGTYYSHFGPMVKIRDKKDINGNPMYITRLKPATVDGTRMGEPVLLSPERLDKLKMSSHFNSQQLCDPTPESEIKLDKALLRPINRRLVPRDVHKFMVIDQAGGDETDKLSKDLWSFCVLGIKPEIDDLGASNVYLMDVDCGQMSHSEGIQGIVEMYLRNGIIQQLGVEKVGLSTTEIHIANALRAKGRRVSLEARNLVLLKPAGRSKVKRVEAALQWPLLNGKLLYCDDIPRKYIDAIGEEMDKFPYYHVDIIDGIAYGYDMFKEFRFMSRIDRENFSRPLHLASCPI